jgi:hypothetical protein
LLISAQFVDSATAWLMMFKAADTTLEFYWRGQDWWQLGFFLSAVASPVRGGKFREERRHAMLQAPI